MGDAGQLTHTFFSLLSFEDTFFALKYEQILVYPAITYDEVHILCLSLLNQNVTEGKLFDGITLKMDSFFLSLS